MATKAVGLLAGWRQREAEHCLVLTLQILESEQAAEDKEFGKAMLAVSDGQLCSLIRDLSRTAVSRNLEIWPRGARGRPPGGVDRLLSRLLGRRKPRPASHDAAVLLLPHLETLDKLAA